MRSKVCSPLFSACFLVIAFISAGCQPTVLPPSGARSPTDPMDVKIYKTAPGKYEVIGVVETSKDLRWGADLEINPVMDALKSKAAAMGANGLLLYVEGSTVDATGKYQGESYKVPIDTTPATKAMATAIYVPQ